jgi:hypothetical protein
MSARHDRFGRSHSHHSGHPVDVAAYDESRSLQCQVY